MSVYDTHLPPTYILYIQCRRNPLKIYLICSIFNRLGFGVLGVLIMKKVPDVLETVCGGRCLVNARNVCIHVGVKKM